MKRLLFLLVIVSLFLMSACSKDNNSNNPVTSTPLKVIQKDDAKALLCIKTKGTWVDMNGTCICNCDPSIEDCLVKQGKSLFIENTGCTTQQTICSIYNGTWIIPRKAILQRTSEYKCSLLPNATWSKDDDSCIILNDNVGTYLKPPKCLINSKEVFITEDDGKLYVI
jgi:hypothetical protein